MFDPQFGGVKKGVILINQRVIIPEYFPPVTKLEEVESTPILRSIIADDEDWQFAGDYLLRVVYSTAKPVDPPERDIIWNEVNSQENPQGKDFFDDGFSDHDEFAEEEVILSDEIQLPNRLKFVLEKVTLEDTFNFIGRSPMDTLNVPELESLTVKLVEVESKVRDERTIDISAVLLIEQEQSLDRQEWLINVGEFQHPLALSSWPPGMAEVIEWHTAFRENKLLLRDNELLLTGELHIQVIGMEKEGGERVFTEINATSPLSWSLNLPTDIKREAIQGIKVITEKVVENSLGLSVEGALHLDMDSANMLKSEDALEQTELEQTELEQLELEQIELEQIEPEPVEVDSVKIAEVADLNEQSNQAGSNLEWLQEWVEGGNITKISADRTPEGNANNSEIIAELLNSQDDIEPVGIYSGEIDPDSEELLRSFDLDLTELPTLEEVMAEQHNSEVTDKLKLAGAHTETKYNLQYTDTGKVKTNFPETNATFRRGLTQLKYLNRLALPDEIVEIQKQLPESKKTASPAPSMGRWTLYRVKAGDTVAQISEQYGIAQEVLQTKNNLSGDSIEPSSMIWIPK